MNNKHNVISLFSGCGGLDLGFVQAGFNIIWANDNNKTVEETYKKNVGNHIVIQDIREINEASIPDGDVLLAGFPCQPFSNAGNRKGIDDHRGTLFEDVLRVARKIRPKIILLENVRGILSSKYNEETSVVSYIKDQLSNINPTYNVQHFLVNAADFGVPQNRKRVLIIAIRSDISIDFNLSYPTIDYEQNKLKYVLNVHDSLPNANEILHFTKQSQDLIPHIKEGGSWKDIPYNILPPRLKKIRDEIKKYRSPNFYRRFSRDEINGTITATATPENCGIIHPTHDRRYSVREIARIQSFPDNFIFYGALSHKYKMIGNAVPPRLGYQIALQIQEILSMV